MVESITTSVLVSRLEGYPMRKGGRTLILLGVTLALAAAVLAIIAFQGIGESDDASDADVAVTTVVEASRDIPANRVITSDDVRVVEVEQTTVGPGTASSTGQVIGLTTAGTIVGGQRILMANLATPGLSHLVDDGLRAVAIPIDRFSALGGMIRADDRVDVIFSVRLNLINAFPFEAFASPDGDQDQPPVEGEPQPAPQDDRPDLPLIIPLPGEPGSRYLVRDMEDGDPVTKLVLQNIRVVRVVAGDQTVDTDAPVNQPSETNQTGDSGEAGPEAPQRLPSSDLLIIEVDAEQAELIKFMLDTSGRYQIALRSNDDQEILETPGMTYVRLVNDLGLPVPLPVQVPESTEEE